MEVVQQGSAACAEVEVWAAGKSDQHLEEAAVPGARCLRSPGAVTDASVLGGELCQTASPGPARDGGPRACSVIPHTLAVREVPRLARQALRDEGEIPGLRER